MSESFEAVLGKVNYGRYIDKIQDELKQLQADTASRRSATDAETYQESVQSLIRKEAMTLAKEVGLQGNPVMVYLMATSIVATAWVAFTLKREASDLTKSPEDRLATMEMLDALGLALGAVVDSATNYADRYAEKPKGSDSTREQADAAASR